MTAFPLVSICVPIYGVEKYIERCAIALFEQTYENIEYIFVNDCTPDRSVEILQEVINQYPQRSNFVKLISHKKNRGLAAARNTAVECCNGEFLLHVDSDDYIEIDAVDKLVAKQLENNADIVSGSYIIHQPQRSIEVTSILYSSSKELSLRLLAQNISVNIWGRLIRTSLYKDNNIVAREGWNLSEDYLVSPVLAFYAKKINVLSDIIYHYDFTNPNSYVSNFSAQKSKQSWNVFYNHVSFFQDKGHEYRDALDLAKVKILTRHLFSCCNDGKDKDYYLFLRKEQETTKRKKWKLVDFKMRILLYLRSWALSRFYVHFLIIVKRIIDSFYMNRYRR